jgi:hypothetical protein
MTLIGAKTEFHHPILPHESVGEHEKKFWGVLVTAGAKVVWHDRVKRMDFLRHGRILPAARPACQVNFQQKSPAN